VIVELETVKPDGRLSVKLTPVSEAEPGLLIVKVSVDVPPGFMLFGANDLMMLAFTIFAKRVDTS